MKYQSHSSTSRAAAIAAVKRNQGDLKLVLGFLRKRGHAGATDEELGEQLQLHPNTTRARRCSLYDMRLVADSGRVRLTHAKRDAVVWVHYKWTPPGYKWRTSTRSVTALKHRIAMLESQVAKLEMRLKSCNCGTTKPK